MGTSVLALLTWLPLYPLHLVAVIATADTAKQPLYEDTADGVVKLWHKGRWSVRVLSCPLGSVSPRSGFPPPPRIHLRL